MRAIKIIIRTIKRYKNGWSKIVFAKLTVDTEDMKEGALGGGRAQEKRQRKP